jgi:XTP/dITP diphosphohydrolase
LLRPLGIDARSLQDLGALDEVEETGATFAANAALKAQAAVRATGLPALADDSGLEVDALGGEPGVRSARWAGMVTAAERNALLLRRLKDVPEAQRGARFVCVIAVCHPDGRSAAARGEISGRITWEPLGDGGFGYDPLFLLPEVGRTYAQLTPEEKNSRSHRARAFAALQPLLPTLLFP